MAGVAPIVRGAPQDPGPVKISSTQLTALNLLLLQQPPPRHEVDLQPNPIRVLEQH